MCLCVCFSPILEKPITPVGWVGTVRRSLQIRQKEEGLVEGIFLREIQYRPIESDEDRYLHEGRDAPREGIDLVRLVYLGDLLVHDLGVGLVLGLEGLDGRLQRLGVRVCLHEIRAATDANSMNNMILVQG